jgi:hypothetical protein
MAERSWLESIIEESVDNASRREDSFDISRPDRREASKSEARTTEVVAAPR